MNYTFNNNVYKHDTILDSELDMLKTLYQKWKNEFRSLEERVAVLKMYNDIQK